MGSLLTKSPQEHTLATARSAEKKKKLALQPVESSPAPGYIRVHFHSHLFKICDRSPPDIAADIPLSPSGGLDLDVVRRRWGLETCVPVDPLRWKPFQPTQPNYLSPVAIQILSEGQGCVKVIEPFVSHQTLMQRNARRLVFNFFSLIRVLLVWLVEVLSKYLAHTPLPTFYRRLRSHIQEANDDAHQINWTWADVQDFLILFMWIGLATAWLGGFIDLHLAPQERARKWARTGSIFL
ncbi:hypothetical protein C8F01DRAFT_1245877 [Mycena amicta]|nr:hypothetical protein C8F01DRAFT_1245877 [Mycena amicta]